RPAGHGARAHQLPFRARVRERGAAPALDCLRRAPARVAAHREVHQDAGHLSGRPLRRDVRRTGMTLRSTAVLFALGAVVAGCGGSPDSTPSADPASSPAESSVVRLDPALDAIVPPGAEVEKVADGFQFTEGPLWHPGENRLWFSDVVGNVLRAVTPDGEVEVLLEESGGPSTAPPGSYIGSNGLLFEEGGSVLMTQHASRRIVRVGPDRELSVVVDRHDGKRLNSPNDL